ncbi:prephenate dehydrogenase [Bifidobacterium bombi DSM 19703]|uniref:Prephenate dehydrogenase n=1 Tax=Bifidobacterium bombi DSM 19703 TaxID=1341695 RepID=A0A080N4I7_9BIFI|nr:prephenate dehydrogenase [Bifidobacterium bombi DSM 19703]
MVSEDEGNVTDGRPLAEGAWDESDTVGIIGLGLIGGSLAQRLTARGVRVVAWNHRSHPYAAARAQGIECVDTIEEVALARPRVLLLCNPLKAMPEVLASLKPVIDRRATILSDVGSVKALVREQVKEVGLEACYVGSHPMCGNERSGFDAADARLFDDALWALTVDEGTDYRRFLTMARFVLETVGDRFIVVDDATHDRAAAMISHAPHAVATALINGLVASPDRDVAVALSAGSWRDMTRVALTDPARTRAMIEENSGNVEVLLRSLARDLNDFADVLHAADESGMVRFFSQGQPFRAFKAHQGRQRRLESASPGVAGVAGVGAGNEDVRRIDPSDWRSSFLTSARAGEQVVGFVSPWVIRVVPDCAI